VIAEKIPKTLPDCAARVIRSHLDYLLTQAVEASKVPPQCCRQMRMRLNAQFMPSTTLNPLKALKLESNFTRLRNLLKHIHKAFGIDMVLVHLIQRFLYDTNPVTISYRWDGDFKVSRSELFSPCSQHH